MKVCVIGTGYVGLVAGTCLAEMGNDVICVDNNKEKLNQLNNGIIPIYEPGLEDLIQSNVQENRLHFSSDLKDAVQKSLICFIAVGTPQGEDGSADLQYVLEVAESIGESINAYKVIVDKSTVPVGTAEKVFEIIKQKTDIEFDVVSNPEFLKQGAAVEDFMRPDRVVIGANSEKSKNIMLELYEPFVRNQNPIITMDLRSAEMVKYASNSFLAVKISYANEIANLCEAVGANANLVRLGMCADTRIGTKFLYPGIGYGGSCFPKDVKAMLKTASDFGTKCPIIESADKTNKLQRELFTNKILKRFGDDLSGLTFAVWGLAFKPKTNDMREAPSITIIETLLDRNAKIQAYDPKAYDCAKNIFGDKIIYTNSSYEALNNADCMLLLTEWNEFRRPDFEKMKLLLKQPIIFDGRNQYNADKMKKKGFEYYQIGVNDKFSQN